MYNLNKQKFFHILIQIFLLLLVFNIDYIIFKDSAYIGAFEINYFYIKLSLKFVIALIITSFAVRIYGSFRRLCIWILMVQIFHAVMVFLITYKVSSFFADYTLFMIGVIFNNFVLAVYVMTFLIIMQQMTQINDWKIFIKVIPYVFITEIVVQLWQIMKLYSILVADRFFVLLGSPSIVTSKISIVNNLLYRGYGTTPHPNILAFWIFTLLCLIAFLHQKQQLSKKDLYIDLVLGSIGILLSFSKAGIMSILGLGIYLTLSNYKKFYSIYFKKITVYALLVNLLITFIIFGVSKLGLSDLPYFIQTRVLILLEYKDLLYNISLYRMILYIVMGLGVHGELVILLLHLQKVFRLYNYRILIEPIHNLIFFAVLNVGMLPIILILRQIDGFFISKHGIFKYWWFILLGIWGAVDHLF